MLSLADSIKSTLEHSITSISSTFSAQKATRSRKLSVEKTIHLLIGADGGSLAKELHRVGIDATPAAVSQRRANIPPDVFQNVFNNFNTRYGAPVACFCKLGFEGRHDLLHGETGFRHCLEDVIERSEVHNYFCPSSNCLRCQSSQVAQFVLLHSLQKSPSGSNPQPFSWYPPTAS